MDGESWEKWKIVEHQLNFCVNMMYMNPVHMIMIMSQVLTS